MNKKGITLESIIELYNQNLTIVEIAEKLGCSLSNISRRFKKAGISYKRDYSKRRMPNRINRHKINEDFFEAIDSESKAYFLGLMYSDGSVSKNTFYLKLKDEDIILKFRDALECDYPVKKVSYGGYNAYILEVSSQTSCNNLIKQGCFINKTKIIRLPKLKEDL